MAHATVRVLGTRATRRTVLRPNHLDDAHGGSGSSRIMPVTDQIRKSDFCYHLRRMLRTITATIAAKRLREVLNAVEHAGETFRIERHGKAIAEIRPTAATRQHSRWGDVLATLHAGPQPDAGFAADLESIRKSAGATPVDPWELSSTPRF